MARIAGRQHGVATRRQLLRVGITAQEIKRRLRNGALIAVHPIAASTASGTALRVSRPGTWRRFSLAAPAPCSRPAAFLHRLIKGRPPAAEVLTPTERQVSGVRTRQSREIDPRDAAAARGIPVTTVPRTIVDLARVLSLDDLARSCHEAGVLHATTPAHVEAVLARRPNSPGSANLRRILRGDVRVTLSKLERGFLELLRGHGLPLPLTNRPADGRRVDCRWPQHRLTVELDSYRYHGSRHAWERDRRREREAHARGDDFRRYTHGDVFEDTRLMLSELRQLLS